MVEPVTVNRGLIIPNTGDLPGTWGEDALNPDFVALDGMLGGFQTITLSNSPVTLSVPSGFVATPGVGPTQSQNALLTFSGTLTSNVTVTFPMPGFYIIQNLCTVGAFYVALSSTSPGKVICAPPGEAVHVFNNGTDMFYVNLGRVGSYLDLCTAAAPAWMTGCSVPPYLLCDGSTFNAVTYPQLAVALGTTTLPDYRGRVAAYLNGATSRITTAGCGVDGSTRFAAGGAQNQQILQTNFPDVALPVTDPGHSHPITTGGNNAAGGEGPTSPINVNTSTGTATTGISVRTGGSGTPLTTMPPVAIAGIRLIRAA